MANEEQLAMLKKGNKVWNEWREKNPDVEIGLWGADLKEANLWGVELYQANLRGAYLRGADLRGADLRGADFRETDLRETDLRGTNFGGTDLRGAYVGRADLRGAYLNGAHLTGADLSKARIGDTVFGDLDLSEVIGLENVIHIAPSHVSTDIFSLSKKKISEIFLRGCGLSDWEIEETKLYNPDLSNGEIDQILYRIHDLRASQALQISPLFISYSHGDGEFVDRLEFYLNDKGVRFWRDIHDMKAGRMETQIDRALRQNPTVLLVLSERSLSSDWVEHEVRTARELGKELERDTLCPVALDDSWKSSRWPKRVMEQIMEYNILDFSAWEDDVKFEGMFRKLIDGLELFYKG